jgi:endonuclease YncB( thermonuclease family)
MMPILGLLLAFFLPEEPTDLQGKVVRIADGDTITILVDRQQFRVRLNSIDAPERGQEFSQRSRQALADLVFGKEVRVETHGKDRYGRVIGDVYVDGKLVNEIMVRDGWAWNYVKYSKSPKLAQLEREAREAKRGLWAGKNPVPPWDYRAEQAKKRQEKRRSGTSVIGTKARTA